MKRLSVILLLIGVLAVTAATASAGTATMPAKWRNCTAVNQHYRHGVGRNNAHDHTSGVPVTSFKHSTTLYKTAMHYNKGLDRDRDGIACEKP